MKQADTASSYVSVALVGGVYPPGSSTRSSTGATPCGAGTTRQGWRWSGGPAAGCRWASDMFGALYWRPGRFSGRAGRVAVVAADGRGRLFGVIWERVAPAQGAKPIADSLGDRRAGGTDAGGVSSRRPRLFLPTCDVLLTLAIRDSAEIAHPYRR